MSEILRHTISDDSAWTADDLVRDRSWEVRLGPAHVAEFAAGLAAVQAQGLSLQQITRANFPCGPALRDLAAHVVSATRSGRGFTILRGLPVDGHSDDEVRLMYWGFCQHLGLCVSQDVQCALVADVKEKGIAAGPLTRAYGSKRVTSLHVDGTDVVGLLAVRQAPSSPLTTLASSITIHNEFLAQHPEWLPRLYAGFPWDRKGEQAAWEAPLMPQCLPVFSYAGGQLSAHYNRSWITSASVRRNLPFSDEEVAMLDFFDAMAKKHAYATAMAPGDVYFANNYTVLHGREGYEEDADTQADLKRLFLRIWFFVPEFRAFADEAVERYGITSFGNMGWTAQELAQGRNLADGHRRDFLHAVV